MHTDLCPAVSSRLYARPSLSAFRLLLGTCLLLVAVMAVPLLDPVAPPVVQPAAQLGLAVVAPSLA